MRYMSTVAFVCCPQFVSANAFKTLFILLTLLATWTQCVLNEKNMYLDTLPAALDYEQGGDLRQIS